MVKLRKYWYLIFLLLVVIIGIGIYFYKLDNRNFYEDEFQVTGTAKSYLETKTFYRWDWINKQPKCLDTKDSNCVYKRAFIHTFLVAKSFSLFGISEWSARFVSAMSGLIFLFISFFIFNYFSENKLISLVSTATLVFYPSYIEIFRYTRMYSLLIPIFLIIIFLSYKSFSKKTLENLKTNKKLIFYPLSLVLVLYLGYLLHPNSLFILPALVVFLIYLLLKYRNKTYLTAVIISFLFALIFIILAPNSIKTLLNNHFCIFCQQNYEYFNYFFSYPFGLLAGTLIILANTLLNFKKIFNDKIAFVYIIVLFSLPFLIFFANRYQHVLYGSHILSLSIFLIILNLYYLTNLIIKNKKVFNWIFILVVFLFSLINLTRAKNNLYFSHNNHGNYRLAYSEIVKNYNPGRDVIFGQYLRDYYLKDINRATIISMQNYQKYSYQQFQDDLTKYESGWITWESVKSYHLDPAIIDYIKNNFQKIHGWEMDNSNVEVYYFKK
jgi:hypothetical protein